MALTASDTSQPGGAPNYDQVGVLMRQAEIWLEDLKPHSESSSEGDAAP
jgi:hypothetical protein